MAFIGAMERVRAEDGPRFLVKGGVSIELRLGLRARATKHVDLVFAVSPTRCSTQLRTDSVVHSRASRSAGRERSRKSETPAAGAY
jgi:hypothetical protein